MFDARETAAGTRRCCWNKQHGLCRNRSLAGFVRHRVQGAESTCCTGTTWPESSWQSRGRRTPAPPSPPVRSWSLDSRRGLAATCSTGAFSLLSVAHVSSCCFSPLWAQSRLCVWTKKRAACQNCDVKVPCSVSQCQGRFGVKSLSYCTCEHCHVLHCKWLIALCQLQTQFILLLLDILTVKCCSPEEMKATPKSKSRCNLLSVC